MKKQLIFALLAVTTIIGIATVQVNQSRAATGGSASFAVGPASGAHMRGDTFTVTVTETSTDQVDSVQSDVAFDLARFESVSFKTDNTSFDLCAGRVDAAGIVSIGCTLNSAAASVTGTKTIGTITVKVKSDAPAGDAKLTFADSSKILKHNSDPQADPVNVWNGNTTGGTYAINVPNPGDTQVPALTITAPAGGQVVSGTITFSANASDNVGVGKVDFLTDNVVRLSDTTAPYSASIDTKALSDGSHDFTAKAYDAAGNVTSASVTVTVKNNTGTTPASTTPSTTKTTTTTKPTNTGTTSTTTTQPTTTTTATTQTTAETTPYNVTPLPDKPTAAKHSAGDTAIRVGGITAVLLGLAGIGFVAFRIFVAKKAAMSAVQPIASTATPALTSTEEQADPTSPTPVSTPTPATPQSATDPVVIKPTVAPSDEDTTTSNQS